MAHVSFYCENCGKRVGPSARVCPYCGRFFTAVKCPVCRFSGEVGLFMTGCPSCGYTGDERRQFEVINLPSSSTGLFSRERSIANRRRKTGERPGWLFALTMVVLGLAFLVLVVIYLNL